MPPPDAPPSAALVDRFCNTLDLEDEPADPFIRPEGVAAWLRAEGLLAGDAVPTETERRTAVELREALRDALDDDGGRAADGRARLDELATRLPLRLTALEDPPRVAPLSGGVAGGLAAVLAAVAGAVGEGSWDRLKVCSRPTCRWVFYDASRNRSRHWCSMSGCGNKAKTSAYRERRRGAGRG